MKDLLSLGCTMGHAYLPTVAEAEQTMGMSIANQRVWTVADVWALPADPHHRYEAVDGTLLMTLAPSREHQRAVRALLRVLHDYASAAAIGEALSAPYDIVLDDRTVVQPDVCVIPTVSAAATLPLLAVEVLSPGSARYDRLVKRARYQRAGVEYWIVDLDSRLVERWTPDSDRPEICAETVQWQATGASTPFVLDVPTVMREVHGER